MEITDAQRRNMMTRYVKAISKKSLRNRSVPVSYGAWIDAVDLKVMASDAGVPVMAIQERRDLRCSLKGTASARLAFSNLKALSKKSSEKMVQLCFKGLSNWGTVAFMQTCQRAGPRAPAHVRG